MKGTNEYCEKPVERIVYEEPIYEDIVEVVEDIVEKTIIEEIVEDPIIEDTTSLLGFCEAESIESGSADSLLDLEITESFKLERFLITAIRIIPKLSADIDICIYASNRKQYFRTFSLTGKDYTDYQTDDYLYDYIQKNIATIYGA